MIRLLFPSALSLVRHVRSFGRERTWHFGRDRAVLLPELILLLMCAALAGCMTSSDPPSPAAPLRDINAVLADHDDELLAIPGVAGVYVGLLPDGATPCLRVMLVRKDPAVLRRLPRTLEGHPVLPEVTGEIKPLRSGSRTP